MIDVGVAIIRRHEPVSHESASITFADGTFFPRPSGLEVWVAGASDAALQQRGAGSNL
jgi:hypothetical protein